MRTVRLPLHLGVDALWRAAGVSALLFPGVVLVVTSVHLEAGHPNRLGLGAIGLVAIVLGAALVLYAWWSRASDAVFSPEGIRIEGGPHAGTTLRWDEIASARMHSGEMSVFHELLLSTRNGETFVLAEAADVAEIASLKALQQTLQARLGEEPEPLPRRADVACCSRCGAPLLPTDQPVISCNACGTVNHVDSGLRERVAMQRSADQTLRVTSMAIQKLLDQPGAKGASMTLIAASIVCGVVWGAVGAAYSIVGSDALDWFTLGVGFFNGWSFTFALFGFARIALARRRALLMLSTTFGARPPVRPGDAPSCRQCGAPLPVGSGVLVCCVYCGTQSVLGLNVRPLLQRVQEQGNSIDKLLAEQAAERSSWIKLGVGGIIAALFGGLLLTAQIGEAHEFANDRKQCNKGIGKACAEVGSNYYVGATVREDKAASARYYRLACDRDHAESCRDLAFQFELGIGVPRDGEQAKTYYDKACRLGFLKACDQRKEMDE